MAFQSVTDSAVEQAQQSTGTEPQDTQTIESGSEGAPDVDQQTSTEAKQFEAVADLSKFKKIMLDGKELSVDELKKERMREADYRRKTMDHAEKVRQHETSAKFDINYRSDLRVVKAQPWRAAEFYRMYPTEFHDEVKWIEQLYKSNPSLWTESTPNQGQASPRQAEPQQDIKRLIEDTLSERLKPFEEKEKLEQERMFLAQLDARETKLLAKYPEANKFEIYAAAEYLSKEGDDGKPKELTDGDWEKIFKDSHERQEAKYAARQANVFNNQKQANKKLKDTQSGGGIPGEAPVVARTLREAKEQFLRLNEG